MTIQHHLPWWIAPIAIYLVWVGFAAHSPRVASIRLRFLFPLFLLLWTVSVLREHQNLLIWKTIVVTVFALIGLYIGIMMTRNFPLQADKKRHLTTLPGGWTSFFLVIALLTIRIIFETIFVSHPQQKDSLLFYSLDLLFTALITGIFIGRFATVLYKYCKAPHSDLLSK